LLTITAGGELYHARLIEIDEALTAGVIERVALELQRTLDHFDRQFPFVTVSQLLVAPFEGRDEVMAHFKNALYIKVEPFELSDVFDFSDHVPQLTADTQATLLPVLGAALREEVAA
jgi:MSHA biogenesis protein MshI